MKRYETFLDKHCGQPFANIEEDANGGLVMYDDAMEEITRLNARVAELEKDSFKNGMKDLLLQAMASTSEMPMYPVELETEDGSFIKAVIAIKIQAVGVAK